jgi:hypothetical protein
MVLVEATLWCGFCHGCSEDSQGGESQMKEAITGASTGDVLGHYDSAAEIVTDIQGRVAYGVKSYAIALDVMRMWCWNV